MDCNPPGSSVHGISQERTLEWVAISSSRGSSQSRDWTHIHGGFSVDDALPAPPAGQRAGNGGSYGRQRCSDAGGEQGGLCIQPGGRDPRQSTQRAPTSYRRIPGLSDTTCYSHCSFHYYSGPRRGGEGETQSHWLESIPENILYQLSHHTLTKLVDVRF